MPDNKTVTFDAIREAVGRITEVQRRPGGPAWMEAKGLLANDLTFIVQGLIDALAAAPTPAAQSADHFRQMADMVDHSGEATEKVAAQSAGQEAVSRSANPGLPAYRVLMGFVRRLANPDDGELLLLSDYRNIARNIVQPGGNCYAAPVNSGEREQSAAEAYRLAKQVAQEIGFATVSEALTALREQRAADLEREHFGDPDKRTGIYAEHAADAPQVGGRMLNWDSACVVLVKWLKKNPSSFDAECELYRELAALTSPAKEQK